jgi:hypothetical protein
MSDSTARGTRRAARRGCGGLQGPKMARQFEVSTQGTVVPRSCLSPHCELVTGGPYAPFHAYPVHVQDVLMFTACAWEAHEVEQ